jgi:cytochrome P450
VEELFRVRPPVPTVERAGLTLDIAAANRDPEMFRSPNRIEPLHRRASRHLSFGAGPHACPGRAQATAEAIALLHELTRRYPGLRLVDEVAPHPVVDVG